MTLNLEMVPIDTLPNDEEQTLGEGAGALALAQAVTDLGRNVTGIDRNAPFPRRPVNWRCADLN